VFKLRKVKDKKDLIIIVEVTRVGTEDLIGRFKLLCKKSLS